MPSRARICSKKKFAAPQRSCTSCAPGPPYGFNKTGTFRSAEASPGMTSSPCRIVPSSAVKSTNCGFTNSYDATGCDDQNALQDPEVEHSCMRGGVIRAEYVST